MATTVRISGVDIEREKGSLQINTAIEQRSTASFVVVDSPGAASYVRGQAVEIFTDLAVPPFIHVLFGGFISSVRKLRLSPASSTIYHAIQCMDYHYLADKRMAAESYVSQTAKYIVEDLWTNYLQVEGIVIGEVQTGPTIEQMVINYQPISLVLDALSERAGFIWQIDEFKRLWFMARTTIPAPFDVDTDDIQRESSLLTELSEDSPKYRNRQYIRAGRDVTSLQTENRTGDGVTKAFALGYPPNQVPVITVGGAAQTVGIKGLDTAKHWYWSKGDPIVLAAVAPGLGVAIVFAYYGEYDIMVLAEDTPEINARKALEGGTGVVEELEDQPSLNSKQAALDSALALLEKYGISGKQFTFPLRRWGIHPGQMVTVDYPEYGLNSADLLVESVDIAEFAPGVLRYAIQAIEGPELGDWTEFFGKLANMKEEVLGRLNIGKDQILIILASVPEIWEWDEAITETVWACPIPSVALFPSVSLYPC